MSSIRKSAVDKIADNLGLITTANGYNFDVGSERIYRQADSPELMPTPSIIVMQGPETIENEYSDLYECGLEIIVGFVDNYNGIDPEGEANLFLADIQKAIGQQFTIAATRYGQSDVGTTTIQIKEEENAIMISNSLPGYIIGQISYEMRYRRHILDPNRC